MRYAQGGGLTAECRRRREQVRREAVKRFEQRAAAADISPVVVEAGRDRGSRLERGAAQGECHGIIVGRRTPGRNGNYTSTLEPADPARVGTIRRSFLPARGRYS